MKLGTKGNVKGKIHQVKGNLEETIAKRVMKSESDIQATVEDVNVKVPEKVKQPKKVVKK